ncbi:hypothetical protein [Zhongshania borealis]
MSILAVGTAYLDTPTSAQRRSLTTIAPPRYEATEKTGGALPSPQD